MQLPFQTDLYPAPSHSENRKLALATVASGSGPDVFKRFESRSSRGVLTGDLDRHDSTMETSLVVNYARTLQNDRLNRVVFFLNGTALLHSKA